MAVTLQRANGFSLSFQEATLVSVLNAMQVADLYQTSADNVLTLRTDPGHLCLMDACQQNLDITTLYNVSHDEILAPFNLRFTLKDLSDSVDLNTVLAALGRPAVTSLDQAFMATFQSTLPRAKTFFVDETTQATQLIKKTTVQNTTNRSYSSFIDDAPAPV